MKREELITYKGNNLKVLVYILKPKLHRDRVEHNDTMTPPPPLSNGGVTKALARLKCRERYICWAGYADISCQIICSIASISLALPSQAPADYWAAILKLL